jgi:hypothetical protein
MGVWLLCGVIGVWFGQLAQVVVGKVLSRTRVLWPCMRVEKDCDHVSYEYAWSLYVLIINLNIKTENSYLLGGRKKNESYMSWQIIFWIFLSIPVCYFFIIEYALLISWT